MMFSQVIDDYIIDNFILTEKRKKTSTQRFDSIWVDEFICWINCWVWMESRLLLCYLKFVINSGVIKMVAYIILCRGFWLVEWFTCVVWFGSVIQSLITWQCRHVHIIRDVYDASLVTLSLKLKKKWHCNITNYYHT